MSVRSTSLRVGALLWAAALVALIPAPAHAESYVRISGSGSTWSQNALDQWRKNVAANYGMTVNYSGTGSSAGRQDFINQTVDFAISEIPFQSRPEDGSAPEVPTSGYAYLPIVAGGTALMYNLKIGGKRVTTLRLSGETVTKIFNGQITDWSDGAIAADNPDLVLPAKPITPVYRSDGSGTSAQFTLWMSKQYPSLWVDGSGANRGMRSQFPAITPAFKGQSGSLGVAGYVSQDYGEGSITYVEYSYALKAGFPVAQVKNASGNFVEPTAFNVATALTQARINEDSGSPDFLTQILDGVYNSADPSAYPISSYSYMIVPTETNKLVTPDKGRTLAAFLKYVLCNGQDQAGPLGYSPLPLNLVQAAFAQTKRIPGSAVGDYDANTCTNAGVSPSTPPPSAEGAAGSGGGSASGAADAAAAASAASDAVYDANGNLVSGSAAGAAGAVSSPFTLASEPWGAPQITMLVAAALLVVAMIVPPLVSRRLRGRPRDASPTR